MSAEVGKIVISTRVTLTTRQLVEIAAAERGESLCSWLEKASRQAALEQLMSGADKPDGEAALISA
jgi:uncharacterized protein (DUF1778 family)